ncbi:MAG TPA: DegT/DnrJ/EryC1/StrS family aminotransferase [Syntrophales bacterium]|nr:DegT/DnrJ/EryC1/StrS family aminotransferase [Syntrophales bacterium]
MNDQIPFIDLVSLHRGMEEDLVAVFRDALNTGQFIGGPSVEKFEQDFASFCGTTYCIGVNSGTDALRFSLIAAGINKGDIVLTVPNTFIATTEAISQAGADPEFIDINERSYNMDPDKLREFLEKHCTFDPGTGRTVHQHTRKSVTAIIPVHLYGQIADMDRIRGLAKQYNLAVIEDACQAHGAEYFSRRENCWKKAGTMGIAAAFSFYPGKNLGACGEAGAVTTNDEGIARTIRKLRDHGQSTKYHHDIQGYNGRLDAIQAAVLRIKLKRLAAWNDERRRIAKRYNELLASVDSVALPYEPEWSRAVYHLFVIRAQKRDALQSFLSKRNISTGLHYPIPLHQQKAYAAAKIRNGSLLVSERTAQEILSLPIFPGLTDDQQKQVVERIREFVNSQDEK